jgi:hypothetical protein
MLSRMLARGRRLETLQEKKFDSHALKKSSHEFSFRYNFEILSPKTRGQQDVSHAQFALTSISFELDIFLIYFDVLT